MGCQECVRYVKHSFKCSVSYTGSILVVLPWVDTVNMRKTLENIRDIFQHGLILYSNLYCGFDVSVVHKVDMK